jgi:ribosomal protein S18 acetylase RimI-like enzyme
VEIEGPRRRQGLAHYLVAEALHDLSQEGVGLVETHASTANTPALSLFTKLGFETVEHGTIFRKP